MQLNIVPITCWKGSGYSFTNIKEGRVSGNRIYLGTLQKGKTNC